MNQGVEIDHVFPTVLSATENLRLPYDESRLFVCHIESKNQHDSLRRLSGAFAGRPIVALVGESSNSMSVVHAMRDGAAQVVMLPLDVDDFREAITSVALQFGHSASKSRVIAISGAHGGVGATTIAVNLAYELAQTFQLDTVIAELSLNCGVLASYLNIEPQFTTQELFQRGHEVDIYAIKKALYPFGDRLSILAGPSHAATSPSVKPLAISHLIHSLRQLAEVVILDVPSTLDEAQLIALDAADEVVLVADQTVPSLQLTVESLRLGIRTHSPWVVINRFDPNVQALDRARIQKALSIDEIRTVALDHDAIMSSVNCGTPLRTSFPRSKALADIDSLARDVLGISLPLNGPGVAHGLLSNLAHTLGIR